MATPTETRVVHSGAQYVPHSIPEMLRQRVVLWFFNKKQTCLSNKAYIVFMCNISYRSSSLTGYGSKRFGWFTKAMKLAHHYINFPSSLCYILAHFTQQWYEMLRIFSWDPQPTNFWILGIQWSDCHTVPLISETLIRKSSDETHAKILNTFVSVF